MQLSTLVNPSPAAYRPAKHSMHPTSPLLGWYVPARHSTQSDASLEPAPATYLPAPHAMHARVESVLYRPAAHAVHTDAPLCSSVPVTDPAAHISHADTLVDPVTGTKRPAGHPMQLLLLEAPVDDTNRPTPHSVQAAVGSGEKRPARQASHLVAPRAFSASVTDPAGQRVQF